MQEFAEFEGLEALSKEEKDAGMHAQQSMAQARGHLRRRLVILRWRFAFSAVLMNAQDRDKLMERRASLAAVKSDPLLEQVSFLTSSLFKTLNSSGKEILVCGVTSGISVHQLP